MAKWLMRIATNTHTQSAENGAATDMVIKKMVK